MNVDLQKERARATFSPERVTNLLDGSVAQTQRRRQLESLIINDPTGIFDNTNNAYLHRRDRHVRALAKHVRLVELCRKVGIGEECNGDVIRSTDWPVLCAAVADDLPTSLQWIMFVPNLHSLCDDEQLAEWLPLCRDWRMIGCYAQTELGHGSNVRALETTATFLPESKGGMKGGGSFVIHSPTLTSTKFWPGTLGRTANHAMVIARLIDGQGIDRGVHNFLVPLRRMTDHTLLPGVTTGDIGPKIGFNVMDNGFCSFHHVLIPRRNMAMRFAEVDEEGNYRKKTVSDAASKIAYITMMQVRAHICNESGKALAKACTIAIRYSAVRRQGFITDRTNNNDDGGDSGAMELQILNYKQQQHRLFPLLAASYCFFFTGQKVLHRLQDIEQRLVKDQKKYAVKRAEVTDIHASTSSLKSFMTTVAADGMEDCRKACGGHGFLQCSGLPELVTTYLQNPTVEGDNHMLPQQVVKVLLKFVAAVQNRQDLSDYHSCDSYLLLRSLQSIIHPTSNKESFEAKRKEEVLQLPILVKAFRHRAARLLVEIALFLQKRMMKGGETQQEAWNNGLVLMARVSRAYSQFLLLHNFVHGLNDAVSTLSSSLIGPAEESVLLDLARLFGLYWMERELGDFLEEDGFLTTLQCAWIHDAVLILLARIRPNAVALVDAHDFSDFSLKSALGQYDGNVYPAIVEAARRDPLNQTDPGPGYEQHLKRLIVEGVGVYTGTSSRL